MKKLLILLVSAAALLFMSPAGAFAQGRFGVIGGMTLSNAERQSLNRSTMNRFHAGVTFQMKLPFGFSIQPALMYHVKGAKLGGVIQNTELNNTCDLTIGYLELPVSVQWGPDLLLFRPFLDVTPFVGYGLNNKLSIPGADVIKNTWNGNAISRWEYGLGLGIGLEIWKFQVIGRYNWNMGSLLDIKEDMAGGVGSVLKNSFERGKFGGFTLTAAILF